MKVSCGLNEDTQHKFGGRLTTVLDFHVYLSPFLFRWDIRSYRNRMQYIRVGFGVV